MRLSPLWTLIVALLMERVVITGANGLLGEALCRILRVNYEVIPLTRTEVDLADSKKLSAYVNELEFDYLINTAAVSGLEQCMDDPEMARLVNAVAPKIMAEICHHKEAKMIQISTDYVLDGSENVYHADNLPTMMRGSSVYSQTKLAAEIAVTETCENSIIARVSWLFGHGRDSFVDQVITTALAGDHAAYISDKFSIPNFSDDLAPVMQSLLDSDLTGIIHLTNDATPESWFTYAEKIIKTAISLGILNDNMRLISKNKLDEIQVFKQERPRYTAMRPRRLLEELNVRVRNWETGLREFLLQKHENSLTN